MKSKYAGNCKRCGKPYKAGDEIEWSKEEGARHPDCASTGDPARLADELGYIDHRALVATDGPLRDLPAYHRMFAAGRVEPQALRGQVASLFRDAEPANRTEEP